MSYMFLIVVICIYVLLKFVMSLGLISLRSTGLYKKDNTRVSIIVAFRNEKENISNCIKSLLHQSYNDDFLEIVLIDDWSNDGTYEIATEFDRVYGHIHLLRTDLGNRNHEIAIQYTGSKKKALQTGIEFSSGHILLFTDADCRPGPLWVHSVVSCFSKNTGVVFGYSPNLSYERSFTGQMSFFDSYFAASISASGAGLGVFITCNGRNLAYRKEIFRQTNGYSKILRSVSGDDDLFVHNIIEMTEWQFSYVTEKESFVPNYNQYNIREFIYRKTRHVSASKYFPPEIKLFYFFLHMTNNLIYLYLLYFLVPPEVINPWFWILISLKIFCELLYFSAANRIFKESISFFDYLKWDFVQSVYHVLIYPLSRLMKIRWGYKDQSESS